jgi:hypothetical protein
MGRYIRIRGKGFIQAIKKVYIFTSSKDSINVLLCIREEV